MPDLKEQQLYTRALEKNLPWYRWIAVVCAPICVAGFIWNDAFFADVRFPSGIIFIFMIATYINTTSRLRRLHAANARNEYILGKEFRVATYDKDGNEIEEDDPENDHRNT